jgi:geranylgeranyl pyrophosphate synthase
MAEIEACTRIGAMIGGGQKKEVEALAKFGRRLGVMSRLADEIEDCLNLRGDILHRIEFESVPLPLLYAVKTAPEKYERIEGIVRNSHTPQDARELLKICFETESFAYVQAMARKNWKEALEDLNVLNQSYARTVLSSMAKSAYERVNELCI